jgi:hypothetical protein
MVIEGGGKLEQSVEIQSRELVERKMAWDDGPRAYRPSAAQEPVAL